MKIEEVQEKLRDQGISVTAEQIRQSGVAPEDVNEETLPLLIEHFQNQSKLSRKPEPQPPANSKGGGLTKSRKGGLKSASSSITPASTPEPSTPTLKPKEVFEDLHAETKDDLIKFIRDGEELRLGVEGTIDRYIETFSDRLWNGVAERQKARPPRSRKVVEEAKQSWDKVIVELRAEMTEMGIELEG